MKRVEARGFSLISLAFLAAASLGSVSHAQDSGFRLGIGAEYSTGKYGGDTAIDEVYIPVSVTYDAQRFSVRLTVPYLSVQAPTGTSTEGPGGEIIVGEGPVRTESGIGDVLAALTVYDVLSLSGGDFVMDLTGEARFGTADDSKGLGTGQNDYSLQVDAYRFFERLTAIGSAGYSFRGDPANIDLEDSIFASVGGTYAVSSRTRVGLFYDYQEASLPGGDSLQEVAASFSSRTTGTWWTTGYVSAGLTDSSPDWGVGVSFSTGF